MIKDKYTDLPISPQLKHYYRNKKKYIKNSLTWSNAEYKNNPEYRNKKIERRKKYYFKNVEIEREKAKVRWAEKRMKVLEFVGGEIGLECFKCKFNDIRALQVDHINGGGLAESRKFKDNKKYLLHIMQNSKNYQLLCANCNWIKRYENNEIPHKKS